jgi:hypothetical protein
MGCDFNRTPLKKKTVEADERAFKELIFGNFTAVFPTQTMRIVIV